MTPKPPEGYRLAVKGETYDPGEDGKPAYWWSPLRQGWVCWVMPLTPHLLPITENEYEGFSEDWATFAVPLTAMEELAALSQELGLYDVTDNPLVKGENDGSTLASVIDRTAV
jgi:hypothetical protein